MSQSIYIIIIFHSFSLYAYALPSPALLLARSPRALQVMQFLPE